VNGCGKAALREEGVPRPLRRQNNQWTWAPMDLGRVKPLKHDRFFHERDFVTGKLWTFAWWKVHFDVRSLVSLVPQSPAEVLWLVF
jgi:hypothetical protein